MPYHKKKFGSAAWRKLAKPYRKKKQFYGKRPYRKKAKPYRKKQSQLMKLTRKVARISTDVKTTTGILTYRSSTYHRLLAPQNTTIVNNYPWNDVGNIELAVAQLRYYDIKIPGTTLVANFSTGTDSKAVQIVSAGRRINIRANYNQDCRYWVYLCKVKMDTDLTPSVLWSDGVSDATNGIVNDVLIYPSDSHSLNEIWDVKIAKKGLLLAGRQISCSYNDNKPHFFDPALIDAQSTNYSRKNHAFAFLVRVCGVVGHDVIDNTLHGVAETAVDVETFQYYKIKYNAGMDVSYVHQVDGGDDMTTGTMTCNKPSALVQDIAGP